MDYKAEKIIVQKDEVHKYLIYHHQKVLSFADFLNLLVQETSFRVFYNSILVESDFKAFFWENPPAKNDTPDQIYEFVLVKSNSLAGVRADEKAFAAYFDTSKTVVDFPNLGGDAHLIVPTPQGESEMYTHLANFVRNAPAPQIDLFWKSVGEQYLKAASQTKRWLSTSGLGVYWLHVRIDSLPKYYSYQLYRGA